MRKLYVAIRIEEDVDLGEYDDEILDEYHKREL